MLSYNRREFLAAGAAARPMRTAAPAARIDETLRQGLAQRKIPAVVAMAATHQRTLYSGAFGTRDASGVPVRPDSIFAIASMTKAITTVAALQLVEQGKVALDAPAHQHLPRLAHLDVLAGFDPNGRPQLKPAATPVTLRQLLTHTSGFCYDLWDEGMSRYAAAVKSSPQKPGPQKPNPLMFEPGSRWQYGQGIDWAGRLVEAISGLTLEAYFQQKILQPLGMTDTSYLLPEAKFDRFVTGYHRQEDGVLTPNQRQMPVRPTEFNGGGGLYSTAADYIRFMQMILNHGVGPGRQRLLKAATVRTMATNQIGALTAGKMRSFNPLSSLDVDIQPGHTEKWGLGFLINTTAYPGGRAAGSLAWAGFYNTYYWIDPKSRRCGVALMQYLPFADTEALGLFADFERAVYGLRKS